jgi:hypothetical protein
MGLGHVSSGSVVNPAITADATTPTKKALLGGKTATGIASLTSDYGSSVQATVAQLAGLNTSGVQVTVPMTPEQRTQMSLIGLGISQGAMSSQLQSRWGTFVAEMAAQGGAVDPNALVQEVLRESYVQTTEDLRFYAEKVKFYNDLKKQIRDELTNARKALAQNASKKDEDAIDPPYPMTNFDGTYYGTTEMQAQALNHGGDATGLSGGGLQSYTGTPPLAPPPADGAKAKAFVTSPGGYIVTFSNNKSETSIYGADGHRMTQIWGDPHVYEDGRTNNADGLGAFAFGDNSTFILPDGTKVCLNTEQRPANSGIFVTVGVDVLSGTSHGGAGKGPDGKTRDGSISADRVAFDGAHSDSVAGSTSSGVFIVQPDNNILKSNGDGTFSQVSNMDWATYKASHSIRTEGSAVQGTDQQKAALVDGQNVSQAANTCKTKKELETYIQNLEDKLNSVGDDAQLANVDLQNVLQKQQQTLQMMSAISKMLNDTALAIIRKIGG